MFYVLAAIYFRRPIGTTTTTTEAPMTLKETTALYVSLMASTKSPLKSSSEEEVEHEQSHEDRADDETTTNDSAHYEDSDEDQNTHTASSEDLEGHTELTLLDERLQQTINEEENPIEQKLRQLTDTIQNLETLDHIAATDDENRQSFLSLSDLIKTLRPDDKKQPLQIDSHYSSSRVLGENVKPDVVYHPRNVAADVSNRSLFKK